MRGFWVAVKGPFGEAVVTLKRTHWTILETDPFLCACMTRVADPRSTCPRSMRTLLKQEALTQPSQWPPATKTSTAALSLRRHFAR